MVRITNFLFPYSLNHSPNDRTNLRKAQLTLFTVSRLISIAKVTPTIKLLKIHRIAQNQSEEKFLLMLHTQVSKVSLLKKLYGQSPMCFIMTCMLYRFVYSNDKYKTEMNN